MKDRLHQHRQAMSTLCAYMGGVYAPGEGMGTLNISSWLWSAGDGSADVVTLEEHMLRQDADAEGCEELTEAACEAIERCVRLAVDGDLEGGSE